MSLIQDINNKPLCFVCIYHPRTFTNKNISLHLRPVLVHYSDESLSNDLYLEFFNIIYITLHEV